jgi:hypothetical protein
VAAWVVKGFVRKKAYVDFPAQWEAACHAAGFETVEVVHALLTKRRKVKVLHSAILDAAEAEVGDWQRRVAGGPDALEPGWRWQWEHWLEGDVAQKMAPERRWPAWAGGHLEVAREALKKLRVEERSKASFFRRLATKKGAPAIDWETVLFVRRV